jgi:hypothetical protein
MVEIRNKRNRVSFSYEKYKPIRTHDLTLQKQARFQTQKLATKANWSWKILTVMVTLLYEKHTNYKCAHSLGCPNMFVSPACDKIKLLVCPTFCEHRWFDLITEKSVRWKKNIGWLDNIIQNILVGGVLRTFSFQFSKCKADTSSQRNLEFSLCNSQRNLSVPSSMSKLDHAGPFRIYRHSVWSVKAISCRYRGKNCTMPPKHFSTI